MMSDKLMSPGVAKGNLSQAALQLAKFVDRLPPGCFTVALTKPDRKGEPWHIEVQRVEVIRVLWGECDNQG